MNFLLTSESDPKRDALVSVFPEAVEPGNKLHTVSTAGADIPDQPFGTIDDIINCCRARIDHIVRANALHGSQIIVSIENGIIRTNGVYKDICVCIVYDVTNDHTAINKYMKDPITFDVPTIAIRELETRDYHNSGYYGKTAGQILLEKMPAVVDDDKNWMLGLYGTDRKDQIISSLAYCRSIMKAHIGKITETYIEVPDFPKPGVMFRDINPLLYDPDVRSRLIAYIANIVHIEAQVIMGPELRGCMIGPLVAELMGIPFIPIRKPGKTPCAEGDELVSAEFAKEYGTDKVELRKSIVPMIQKIIGETTVFPLGDEQPMHVPIKVVIFDDLVATGGSAGACVDVAKDVGFDCIQCIFIEQIRDLKRVAMGKISVPYDVVNE